MENLVKIFYNKKNNKNIHAIDGVSFKLNYGEIFGFLGPNGAGKTTTIRVLAGLLKPTAGHAFIFGKDVVEMGDRVRKNIGFLTENHGNYENLSVYDNLKFFGGFYDINDIEARIDEILEELDFSDRKHMKVGKLSKGLKQRAALSRVLLHNPKLIFLDEPTAGLDPEAAANVRNIIKGLKTKERTIFINSHNLDEVQKTCDRVGILNNGRLMRIGTASDLGKDLFDSQELIIHVKNSISDEIKKKLIDFNYVENFRFENNQLNIHLKDVDEFTPEIIEFLVKREIKILEVKRISHSLEEIYLTLMSEPEKEKEEGEKK
ncbi:MAG: ABC transporter ATP-binding protein [Promethearchaeota archaeon]